MNRILMMVLSVVVVGFLSKLVYHNTFMVFLYGALCLCIGYLYGRTTGYKDGWDKRGKKDEDDSIEVTLA